jgi:predicted anti-sigma-YlaC factor YlaD
MKWGFFIFIVLYVFALFFLAVGTLGWLGQEDPLADMLLLPLGLPWSIAADKLGVGSWWTAVIAPLLNAGLLWLLWKR